MRNYFLAVSCVLLACRVTAADLEQSLLDAPVELRGGEIFRLADIVGDKPVYLKFWATWCGDCREQMPHLKRIHAKYRDDLAIVSVNIWVNESEQAVNETVDEFGMTVPVAIDRRGVLAQGFEILGTPYHVLIDRDGDVVHTGFDADADLDQKIELLASSAESGLLPIATVPVESPATPLVGSSEGVSVLFFFATWCDWYLADSRPSMSAACIDAQQSMNRLYERQPDLELQGVATRLWTGEKELQKYVVKYEVAFPMSVDTSNETYFALNVKTVPTLVVLKDGREVARTKELGSVEDVAAFVRAAIE